jgi:subtilase family serine protease
MRSSYDRLKTLARNLLVGTALIVPPAALAEVPQTLSHAAATDSVDIDLYFPLRNIDELRHLVEEQVREGSPLFHHWLKPDAIEAQFGPTPETIRQATAEITAHGFSVTERLPHALRIHGSIGAVEAAFGVKINHARFADGSEGLVTDRALTLTPVLAASGVRIPQFTTVAPMHRHSQALEHLPRNYKSAYGPYFAADLRQAYDFPSLSAVNGKGVVIGILMEGAYNASDIDGYFSSEQVSSAYYPKLGTVLINGGKAFDKSNSIETHLDIEQSSGIALGATEILYNLSDLSNPTVLYGLNRMVADNGVDLVNMSFGEPEVDYLAKFNNNIDQSYLLQIEDELFLQGSAQGITFVASSGDHGGDPKAANGKPTVSVEAPSSDPYVTAVGGTNLVTAFTSDSNNSAYKSEFELPDKESGGAVWGSGGGLSIFWAKPAYQKLVPTPSTKVRAVPDIALHMGGCPGDATSACSGTRSADWVAIGGQLTGVIGTSASSPDIVGMFALTEKLNKGRLGPMNTYIYTQSKAQIAGKGTYFHHSSITGNNAVYKVKAPYDLVIGNGTPDVRKFLGITNLSASGVPGTSSNP